MAKEKWICRCLAETTAPDGSKRVIDFLFDGLGNIERGLDLFRRRIRKPSLWLGVEVVLIAPHGGTVRRIFEDDHWERIE